MKKRICTLCALSVVLLLTSCALFPRHAVEIKWPEQIDYMEALCELDMAWKDMNYSGSMALKLNYPDMLQIEVYGPFGETIVFLKKDGQRFLLTAGDETFTDANAFEQKFNIKLTDFIDDLALRAPGLVSAAGASTTRDGYKVSYDFADRASKTCWEGQEGRICVKFLEARFSRE